MGRKKNEEDRSKLSCYVNTPEAMAMFCRLYEIPNNVGLKYVHWSDALPPSSGELLIPVVAVMEGGRKCPTKDRGSRLMPDLQTAKANPENKALPPIDIRDVLDAEAPDMSGINLRNLLLTRREEGTSGNVPASSQPARRKRGRTESSVGPSRPSTSTPPSPPASEAHEMAQGEGSAPLWAPRIEYRGEDVVTKADCILPVNKTHSGSVASALSQVVRLPLDMDKWKKATDDGLINNLRRGLLMGVQASLELEERFRTNKDHLAHANVLALKYQDAKNMAAEAKKLADAADAKRVEAEESLNAALDLLTKAEDKIRALKSEFDQVKKAAYEAGSNDAQAMMGDQLPGVCNEFYLDGWKKAVSILTSGQTMLPPLPPSMPYPGARPPPPPEFVLATPLEVPVTPIPEISTDVVNLEDEVNSAEAAALNDADQAPSVPEGGSAASDEARPERLVVLSFMFLHNM
uniref:Uncharacterized protein n=1 Tax=Fagus sylvatica TaxID=28930 RepID=A0A2N9HV47_FAGSY